MFLTALDAPSASLAQTGYTSPTTQETCDPLARFLRSGKHPDDQTTIPSSTLPELTDPIPSLART
jgi:hypothetical protein